MKNEVIVGSLSISVKNSSTPMCYILKKQNQQTKKPSAMSMLTLAQGGTLAFCF
jgi:hypothetical protein